MKLPDGSVDPKRLRSHFSAQVDEQARQFEQMPDSVARLDLVSDNIEAIESNPFKGSTANYETPLPHAWSYLCHERFLITYRWHQTDSSVPEGVLNVDMLIELPKFRN